MTFESPLVLIDNGDETFAVDRRFIYRTKDGDTIKVPKGFQTDFASIPRPFWNIIPPYGKHGKAAVVHDYLYSTGGELGKYTRAQCDRIFLEAMLESGVRKTRALVMYAAVRAFGGFHFAWK